MGADLPHKEQVCLKGWKGCPEHMQSINLRLTFLLWNWRTRCMDESDWIMTAESHAHLHSIGDDCWWVYAYSYLFVVPVTHLLTHCLFLVAFQDLLQMFVLVHQVFLSPPHYFWQLLSMFCTCLSLSPVQLFQSLICTWLFSSNTNCVGSQTCMNSFQLEWTYSYYTVMHHCLIWCVFFFLSVSVLCDHFLIQDSSHLLPPLLSQRKIMYWQATI